MKGPQHETIDESLPDPVKNIVNESLDSNGRPPAFKQKEDPIKVGKVPAISHELASQSLMSPSMTQINGMSLRITMNRND